MRVTAIFACCLLLASLLAACSGASDGNATLAPTIRPSPSPASTPTSTPPPTATIEATIEATMPSLQAESDRILRLLPVKPANVDLFTSDYLEHPVYPEAYLEGPPMAPAVGTPRSTETMRADLNDFLIEGLGPDAPQVKTTMALFDDPAIIERVPDPLLRAAFVVLNITVAAPIIDSYLTSDAYGGNLEWVATGLAFAESSEPGPDGKQHIGVSDRYEFEHFTAIAPNIVHAILHHDDNFSYPEDVIILTIATVTYLQLLEVQPSIAYQGTELSRFNNTFALALLNSHRAGSPDIELIVPGGTSVLPGSLDDAPDFWSMIMKNESVSPAAPVLPELLANLLTPGVAIPAQLNFSRKTAELISGQISEEVLGAEARVRLSVLLTMISTDEIAALLNLTRGEVVELFKLEGIEAVIAGNPGAG